MTVVGSSLRIAGRAIAIATFGMVLIGLPVAVEMNVTSPFELLRNGAVLAGGYKVVIGKPLALTSQLDLRLESGVVSLPDGGDRGHARGGIEIDNAALTLDLTGSGSPLDERAAEEDYAKAVLAGLLGDVVRLRNAAITIHPPGRPAFRIDHVAATATGSRKGAFRLAGSGVLGGQTFDFEAAWSAGITVQGVRRLPFKLELKGSPLSIALAGTLTTGHEPRFQGQSTIRMASAPGFLAWAGFGRLTRSSPSLVEIAGDVDANASRLAFAPARIVIDGNEATGSLTVSMQHPRTVLDGTLAFQEIDFSSSFAGSGSKSGLGDAIGRFLTDVDADLRVSAGRVRIPQVDIKRAAATITVNSGRLLADVAELEVEGGSGTAHLTIDFNQPVPTATTKVRLTAVDAGRVLAAQLNRNPLLGRTNLVFEGMARGRSVLEALGELSGKGQLELAEPGRLGLDLPALIYAARDGGIVGWAAAGRGGTALDSLTARFRVLNGALTVEALQGRSGSSVMLGSGRLDVPGRLMDMSIATGPVSTTEAPMTITEVLNLQGTWDNPAIRLHATKDDEAAAAGVKPAALVIGPGGPAAADH